MSPVGYTMVITHVPVTSLRYILRCTDDRFSVRSVTFRRLAFWIRPNHGENRKIFRIPKEDTSDIVSGVSDVGVNLILFAFYVMLACYCS